MLLIRGKALIVRCRRGKWLLISFRALTMCLLTMLVVIPAGTSRSKSERPLVMDFLLVGEIGDLWLSQLGRSEPGIDVTLVPLRAFSVGTVSDADLYRLSRIYFPRDMDALLAYRVLFFNCPRLDLLTVKHQLMMVDFAGTGGKSSIAFPLSHWNEVQLPWVRSPLSDVFPLDMWRFHVSDVVSFGRGPLRLAHNLPSVFSVFEITGIFDARVYNRRPCYPKEGATIWVYMTRPGWLSSAIPEAPAFISWPYEDSESWVFGIHPGSIASAPAHVDAVWWELIFLNICYYNSGSEMFSFEEAMQKRSVKTQLSYFHDTTSMFQSIVDFVFLVGGNTFQAESIMLEANEAKSEADRDYLEQRYGEAGDKMETALQLVDEAMDEAQRAKDSALLWIYVVEWLVTTGVALMSGVTLWWLMVRRKLYREVATTQLRHK